MLNTTGRSNEITQKEALSKASNPKQSSRLKPNTTYGTSTNDGYLSSTDGLLTELMGGQPAPARLKIPQKDLLMFSTASSDSLSGVPLAGNDSDRREHE